MMKNKIFTVFCIVSVVATSAMARVHCRPDNMGGNKCVGYNDNGEYVSIRSYTNSFGITTTQGYIGNREINTRTRSAQTPSVTNYNTIPGHPYTRRGINVQNQNARYGTY